MAKAKLQSISDTVKLNQTQELSRDTGFHRPWSIKNQLIDESGKLWGYVVEVNGTKNRIDSLALYKKMVIDEMPVVVDWSGKDKPATVAIVHERTESGMFWYLRTVGDKYTKNNLANVPKLKSQSSHLRKIKRIR